MTAIDLKLQPEGRAVTVCLYVSPPFDVHDPEGSVKAALAADIVVTQKIFDHLSRNIDTRPARTPATSTPGTFHDPVNTRLVRKLNIIGPCAIACASNDGARIADLVFRVEQELDEWVAATPGKPLTSLREIVTNGNDTQLHRREPFVQALAACRTSDGLTHSVYPIGLGIRKRLHHFGWTHAIGSGSETIMNMVEAFERTIDDRFPPNVHPESKIKGLIKYINGCKIAEEIKFGPRENWGGYLESAILESNNWARGESSMYITTVVVPTDDGNGAVAVADVVICYDPDRLGGCVFALAADGIMVFPLGYLVGEEPPIQDFFEAFQGWRPESCVVTTIPSFGPPGANRHRYCRWQDADFVQFAVHADRVEISFHFKPEEISDQLAAIRDLTGTLSTDNVAAEEFGPAASA